MNNKTESQKVDQYLQIQRRRTVKYRTSQVKDIRIIKTLQNENGTSSDQY